ncbi:MAG: hypothetical protein OK457_11905 [Thaumarchaeota archaeon]|nr:hypothetical protein [Nitrososphaerota archaeon]
MLPSNWCHIQKELLYDIPKVGTKFNFLLLLSDLLGYLELHLEWSH